MHPQYHYRHQLILSSSTNYHHLFFIFLIIFLCFNSNNNLIRFSSAQNDSTNEGYTKCGNLFQCGDVTASFPFWGENRPSYCGHAGLELSCSKDITLIKDMASQRYRVMDINNETQTLKLARTDILDGICPTVPSSINKLIFETTSSANRNLSLYDCPALPSSTIPGIIKFTCSESGVSHDFYYFEPNTGAEYIGNCAVRFTVPVLLSSISDGFFNNQSVNSVLNKGFQLKWTISSTEQCRNCTESRGQCGYSKDSSRFVCFCSDGLPHETDCSSPVTTLEPAATPSDKNGKKKVVPIVVGISAAAFVVVFLLAFILIYKRRRQSKLLLISSSSPILLSKSISSSKTPSKINVDYEKGSSNFSGVQIFTYAELEEATGNFDASKELGDGGFGTVYYGLLKDGRQVAVKRLFENNYKRVEQFMNEVEILTRLRHQNLVTLYGSTSHNSRELLLVYEFVANGTVADHLHGSGAKPGELEWPSRMNIAIESASALTYLHATEIIHRDVKTTNILLDKNFGVKVADFGLSRLFPTNVTHVSTAPQGTPGYVDPEYYQCYQLTDKSDVYSFGVVLIELISSKPAVDTNRHRYEINLASMAINKIRSGELHEIVDPHLGFETDQVVRRMIISVAELAFRCLQQQREMRPSMGEVLEVLKGIKNEVYKVENADVVDIPADDIGLLDDIPMMSPDSTTTTNTSTTPNTSTTSSA